jgi:hypothetical protein
MGSPFFGDLYLQPVVYSMQGLTCFILELLSLNIRQLIAKVLRKCVDMSFSRNICFFLIGPLKLNPAISLAATGMSFSRNFCCILICLLKLSPDRSLVDVS